MLLLLFLDGTALTAFLLGFQNCVVGRLFGLFLLVVLYLASFLLEILKVRLLILPQNFVLLWVVLSAVLGVEHLE